MQGERTSERSGVRELSKQGEVSRAEQANQRMDERVAQYLSFVPDHSASPFDLLLREMSIPKT